MGFRCGAMADSGGGPPRPRGLCLSKWVASAGPLQRWDSRTAGSQVRAPQDRVPPARLALGCCSLFRKDRRCSSALFPPSGHAVGLGLLGESWRAPRALGMSPGLFQQRGAGPDHLQGLSCSLAQPGDPRTDALIVLQPPEPQHLGAQGIQWRDGLQEGSRQDLQVTLASGPRTDAKLPRKCCLMDEWVGNQAHLLWPGSIPYKVRLVMWPHTHVGLHLFNDLSKVIQWPCGKEKGRVQPSFCAAGDNEGKPW